ncbi:MAG: polysaccharide deacetylase family protein [Armatimonadota bacterium]
MRRNIGIFRTIFELILIVLLVISTAHKEVRTQSWRGEVIYRVPTKEKVCALTYDDGPHPKYTPEILAILKRYNVKATFFMIGRDMEKYPDVVKDVLEQGDVIANHTYTHPRNIEANTQAQVIKELEKCEDVIERMTGKRAHLFRPPRGMIDGMVFTIAEEEGYRTVLWTVCADHHDAPTPEAMAKRVIQHIRPGAVILAHDGSFPSRWKDVAATPLIIEELRKKGYRFVTVPELIEIGKNSSRPKSKRWPF